MNHIDPGYSKIEEGEFTVSIANSQFASGWLTIHKGEKSRELVLLCRYITGAVAAATGKECQGEGIECLAKRDKRCTFKICPI